MLYWLLHLTRDWLYQYKIYSLFSVLDQIQFRVLAAMGLSFAIVLLGGPATIRKLIAMKLGDTGATDAKILQAHAKSKANTPTMGGVLIVAAIGISILLLADLSKFYVQMALIVLVWLSVLGGVDDYLKLTSAWRGGSRQGLHAWEKLVFQLGLGLLMGLFLYRQSPGTVQDLGHVLNLPFQKTYTTTAGELNPGLWFLPLPIFVLVCVLMITGMSNAVNITDGMDGLASGISAVVSMGLTVLALVAGSLAASQYLLVPSIAFADELAVVAGAMAGACLGFLWWNCSRAQMFMGDTGSLALGGLIGFLAVAIRQEFVALVMSGVFLLEIGSVVIQVAYFKSTGGKRVFKCAPYHHHLHALLWTEQQVVVRLWIVSILLVVVGLASLKLR